MKYHAVINCQSTDLHGLPTSVEVILTQQDVLRDISKGRFYCEISGYNDSIKHSDFATKMFQHVEGCEVLTPEWAIYKLYTFLAEHGVMGKGCFRPVVYGNHSIEVLNNLIDYTNYQEHFANAFDSIVIDVMSYALLVNTFVNMGTGHSPYRNDSEYPSVAYNVVMEAEEIIYDVKTKGLGILAIYRKILNSLAEDFGEPVDIESPRGKCTECGATTLSKGAENCFICGAEVAQ